MALRACLPVSLLLPLLFLLSRVEGNTGSSNLKTSSTTPAPTSHNFNKSSANCSDSTTSSTTPAPTSHNSTTSSTITPAPTSHNSTTSSTTPAPTSHNVTQAAIWSSLGVLLLCCALVLGILCHRQRRRPRDGQTKPETFYEVIKDTGAGARQCLEKTDSDYCLVQTPLPAGHGTAAPQECHYSVIQDPGPAGGKLTQTDTDVEYSTVNKPRAAQNITLPNSDVEYATVNKPRAAQKSD